MVRNGLVDLLSSIQKRGKGSPTVTQALQLVSYTRRASGQQVIQTTREKADKGQGKGKTGKKGNRCRRTYARSGLWKIQVIPHACERISTVSYRSQPRRVLEFLGSQVRSITASASLHTQVAAGAAADVGRASAQDIAHTDQGSILKPFASDCLCLRTHAKILSMQ